LGKNEIKSAQRLEQNLTPKLTLDHIIKERYPTFIDALRDLDDALSMLYLFANLPQSDTVPPKTIALAKRLCLEFEHYLIRTHSLRKSFLSIKGIYYQATIHGQDILWLVPYQFVQRTAGDVDFRIMGTFVEFYTTLVGFVNYRLYTSIGLVYPPKFDTTKDAEGAELAAFKLEGRNSQKQHQTTIKDGQIDKNIQAEADKVLSTIKDGEDVDEVMVTDDKEEDGLEEFPKSIDPTADTLIQPSISTSEVAALFEPFTIFLSRETPRHPLEFILRAFGCKKVGWDGLAGEVIFPLDERDTKITHQIVDRPDMPVSVSVDDSDDEEEQQNKNLRPGEKIPGRIYIQPQWVWDCINAGKLLRTDLYSSGAVLPPHLSPFVKPKSGEYDPTKTLAEQEEDGEADIAAEIEAEEGVEVEDEEMDDDDDTQMKKRKEKIGVHFADEDQVTTGEGMNIGLASSDEDDDEKEVDMNINDEFGGFDSDDKSSDDENSAEKRYQKELEAEAKGLTPEAAKVPKDELRKKREKKMKQEKDEVDRQKMMLSRKKRKLFEKMQYGNSKKTEEAEKLRSKRRKIERS